LLVRKLSQAERRDYEGHFYLCQIKQAFFAKTSAKTTKNALNILLRKQYLETGKFEQQLV
jgi:hypothetical protein